MSCGAERISDVVSLCYLPPSVQLSQTGGGWSVTSPTRREGFLNAGVFLTILEICCQVLICYNVPFPAVRHNWFVYGFYLGCGSGWSDGTVRNKLWCDLHTEGGKWEVWFSWSRVFRIIECFLQFPPHKRWIILDFQLLPCLLMLYSFFWVIPWPLNCTCQWHIQFRQRVITKKNEYNI
jgi:hypothetical protein